MWWRISFLHSGILDEFWNLNRALAMDSEKGLAIRSVLGLRESSAHLKKPKNGLGSMAQARGRAVVDQGPYARPGIGPILRIDSSL
jgi:hypothetical protein